MMGLVLVARDDGGELTGSGFEIEFHLFIGWFGFSNADDSGLGWDIGWIWDRDRFLFFIDGRKESFSTLDGKDDVSLMGGEDLLRVLIGGQEVWGTPAWDFIGDVPGVTVQSL